MEEVFVSSYEGFEQELNALRRKLSAGREDTRARIYFDIETDEEGVIMLYTNLTFSRDGMDILIFDPDWKNSMPQYPEHYPERIVE